MYPACYPTHSRIGQSQAQGLLGIVTWLLSIYKGCLSSYYPLASSPSPQLAISTLSSTPAVAASPLQLLSPPAPSSASPLIYTRRCRTLTSVVAKEGVKQARGTPTPSELPPSAALLLLLLLRPSTSSSHTLLYTQTHPPCLSQQRRASYWAASSEGWQPSTSPIASIVGGCVGGAGDPSTQTRSYHPSDRPMFPIPGMRPSSIAPYRVDSTGDTSLAVIACQRLPFGTVTRRVHSISSEYPHQDYSHLQ